MEVDGLYTVCASQVEPTPSEVIPSPIPFSRVPPTFQKVNTVSFVYVLSAFSTLLCKMPAEISSETKAAILAVRPLLTSPGKISHHMKSIGISVSKSTVQRFLKNHDALKSGKSPLVKRLPPHQLPFLCTKALLRKVKEAAFVENPPSQESMVISFGVSGTTIRRVLRQLDGDRWKKQKEQSLLEKKRKQRRHRGNVCFSC